MKSAIFILFTIFSFAIIWFVVTQPLLIGDYSSLTDKPIFTVNPAKLESHVRFLSQSLPPRKGSEKELEPTLRWIENQISYFGESHRQSYLLQAQKFHNVLLDFGPESNEVIVVGAHYDTVHGYPGADDNASGVASLIELARLLSENEGLLKKRVQLVFFTLEESPFFRTNKMGSYIHASRLRNQNKKVKIMISLDMLGYFSSEKNSQKFPYPLMDKIYSDTGDFIAIVSNPKLQNITAVRNVKKSFKQATSLPVYSMNAPAFVKGVDASDHLNYWKFDYPAVLITDTAFMRNMAYHTRADTFDRLDYKKMAEVVKALYQTVIDYSSHSDHQ